MAEPARQARAFGPVPSRRLGRSLGVDLIPFKTCTFDCVYCQLGRTTRKTAEREEWVPTEEVLEDVRAKLDAEPDYITLSGSGEPTLHARFGEILDAIKDMTSVPTAVLTNSSLMTSPDVRSALASADLIVPSLDAPDPAIFEKVNRPHPSVRFQSMVESLIEFSKGFKGEIWLEIFLLEGMNTAPEAVEAMAAIARRIGPDRIQLNTVSRPPAEAFAKPVPFEAMQAIARRFGDRAEVVADFRGVHERLEFTARREDVLSMLQRRPCTVEDLASGLAMHVNEVVKYVEELSAEGKISAEDAGGKPYWTARP